MTPDRAVSSDLDGGEVPVGRSDDHLAALIRRCARGEEAALGQLYDATSAVAWGLARRVLVDSSHAESALREAYAQVWHRAALFDADEGSPKAWLLATVHAVVVRRLRSMRDSRPDLPDLPESGGHSSSHASTSARARGPLTELTDARRRAVELGYWGGYTHAEVDDFLRAARGTSKHQMRAGLIDLRDSREAGPWSRC